MKIFIVGSKLSLNNKCEYLNWVLLQIISNNVIVTPGFKRVVNGFLVVTFSFSLYLKDVLNKYEWTETRSDKNFRKLEFVSLLGKYLVRVKT